MPDAFVVELTMQVLVSDAAAVSQAAIDFFRDSEFADDPNGTKRAMVEQKMRAQLDQALQTLIRPTSIAEAISGVTFGGGQILVRPREPNERLPWEPVRGRDR